MSDIQMVREITDMIRIVVVGVGGAGGNAVARSARTGLKGVELYAINTDKQALDKLDVPQKILIGEPVTHGLGAGGDPELGRKAIESDKELVAEILRGAHMVFIVAGLGGGTGSGAAPVIAQMAKENGALTVAIVTMPFTVEGRKRNEIAEDSVEKLREYVDTLHIVRNQKLLSVINNKTSVAETFEIANKQLQDEVEGVYEILTKTGVINLDFADVNAVMRESGGEALIGTGVGKGENAAMQAVQSAIDNPFLEDTSIEGAKRGLVNFITNPNYPFYEIDAAANFVRDRAGFEESFSIGLVNDENLEPDEVRVTIIAAGFDSRIKKDKEREFKFISAEQPQPRKETKIFSIPDVESTQVEPGEKSSTILADAKTNEGKSAFEVEPPTVGTKNDNPYANATFKNIIPDDFELPACLRKKAKE